MITVEGPFKSTRKNKKLYVIVTEKERGKVKKQKEIHFGDSRYEDFTQHKDPERRKKYLARASKIRDKQGKLTKNNVWSANYYAIRYLW